MSERVRRNWGLLKILVKAGPRQRKAILCNANNDLVGAIAEIALNTLKGNLPLKPSQYRSLKRKKGVIKKLSDRKVSLKKKKQIILQSGGFIGPLLGTAIPLLTSLLAG